MLAFLISFLIPIFFASSANAASLKSDLPPCPFDKTVMWDNCFGSYTDKEDGSTYTGEWRNNQFDGGGTITRKDGFRLEGRFKNNMAEGYGTLDMPNGIRYAGEFHKNSFHGKGVFEGPGGLRYEGDFKASTFDGNGKLTDEKLGSYEGAFRKGQFEGRGKLVSTDGSTYVGGFAQGKLEGKARMISRTGVVTDVFFKNGALVTQENTRSISKNDGKAEKKNESSSGQPARRAAAKGVVVLGSGLTKDEARKNALRRAIEQTLGALVVSDRRLTNSELFEEDIIFANGVINSYSVIAENFDPKTGIFSIELDVVVSRSTIEKRIFASQSASDINGELISQAIESSRAAANSEIERFEGARSILLYLSKNLATSIFDVKAGEVSIERTGEATQAIFTIDLSVNQNAFESICKAARDYVKTAAPLQNFPYPSHRNFEIRDDTPWFRSFKSSGCAGSTDPRNNWPQGYIVGLEWEVVNQMIATMAPLGACVSFENESGAKILPNVFYKVDLCQRYETPPPRMIYYGNGFCAAGIPNLNNGNNNQTYVSIVRAGAMTHRLSLPDTKLDSLRRVKAIKAQMASEVDCLKSL